MPGLDLTERHLAIEVNRDLLGGFAMSPQLRCLIDVGATMVLVGDHRPGKHLHTDDAGTYTVEVSKMIPTFILGSPADWGFSMSPSHAGMVAPEWPYTHAEYFLANLNDPTPHVTQAIAEDRDQVRQMKKTVPESLVGRPVSSRQALESCEPLITDFLVLSGNGSRFGDSPTPDLVDLAISSHDCPVFVAGCTSFESAKSSLRSGSSGIIIPAEALSVKLVAEVAPLLNG